jgi:AcrR family transcriptional regulator
VEGSKVPQSKPARKQQRRSLVTQQKLLDAAIEAFSENGFKGTSTRDIAERAGVHHPLITYHFKNKDQLWRAAADRIFDEFSEELARANAEHANGDSRSRMASMIRTYVRYAHRQPALHKVLVQEASYPNPRHDWLVETRLRPLFQPMIRDIGELQAAGIAPTGNPGLLYNMIRVCAGGLVALAQEIKGTSDIDLNSEKAIDELAELIIRVFLPGEPQVKA